MKTSKPSIISICGLIVIASISLSLAPTVLASGKSIYGTLYINGVIAEPGVNITIKVDGLIVDTTSTVVWDEDNYILGFNSIYEGRTGYIYVGDEEIVPQDNASIYIGNWIGKRMDLHISISIVGDLNKDGDTSGLDLLMMGNGVYGNGFLPDQNDPDYYIYDVVPGGGINIVDYLGLGTLIYL